MAAGTSDAFVAGQRDVLEGIAAGLPLGQVLERIVRLVEAQAAGVRCSILLLDPEHDCVRHGAAPSLPPGFSRAIDGLPIGPTAGSCGTAAHRRETVVVEDIATDPIWAPYRELALAHGLRACWSSPIFSAERRVLGTFAMYYREPRGPSAAERAWVSAATHLAAVALGRDRTEQALRQSEARYRRIADAAREAIWLVDRAGRTLFANRRVAAMLGCDGADLTGRRLLDFVDEGARAETEGHLALGEAAGPRDVRFRRADGAELWTMVSLSSVTDDAGAVVGTLAVVTDITERKAAETRARQLARLYALSSSVNEAVSRIRDPARLYEHACRIVVEQGRLRLAWVGLYDAASDRLVPVARVGADDGYVDRITVGVHDQRTAGGPAARALREGVAVVANDVARDPGFYTKREALARGLRSCAAFPLTIRGRPTGVLVIYAEQPGYFSDEELRVLTALADHIAFGVESAGVEAERRRLVHDLGERVKELTVLHGAARSLQGDRPFDQALLAELVSLLPAGLQYPDLCVARIEFGGVAAQTPGWHLTPWVQSVTFAGAGQTGRIEVAYLVPTPPAAGGPFLAEEGALLRSLADMLGAHAERREAERERARLETELHQAQRIQALGTLAGGIAHDFNNVITAILGNVEIASRALPPDHRAQRSLGHITQAATRAADLIKRILTFSRRREPQRSRLPLQPIVEEALKLLRSTLLPRVEIRSHFEAGAPAVLADATQVYQVVTNLATNAAHAMGPPGGRLDVRLETVSVDAATPARPADLAEGRYVLLSVSDTGCGMEAATLERIFEPFFTTKPVGEGTGLGLSVVHGIMKSHDGAIAVDSRPGAGTTFRLYFPVADAPAPTPTPA
jgi:PAS domain S-box-containing protein